MRVLLIFAISVCCTSAWCEVEKKVCNDALNGSSWWARTGIRWGMLKFFAEDADGCWKTEQEFVACWAAASELARGLGLRLAISHHALNFPKTEGLFSAGADVKSFGSIVLRQPTSNGEPADLQTNVQRSKQRGQAFLKLYADFSARLPATKSDFATLIEFLRRETELRPLPERSIGLAYQAYRRLRDPVFTLVSIAEADQFRALAADEQVGIGLRTYNVGNSYGVIPTKGGPAEVAGIKLNDELLAWDGRDVRTLTPLQLEEHAIGPVASEVDLKILRNGETLHFLVQRQLIPYFETRLIEAEGGPYAYLLLRRMPPQRDCGEVAAAVQALTEQGARGLVIDVRQNGGGTVDFAGCLGGMLVGEKTISMLLPKLFGTRRTLGGKSVALRRFFHSQTSLPTAILIDGGSASAAELLVGSMQDYQRAWIVGERSMGKGTYSQIFDDQSGKFAVNETVAEYALPGLRTIQYVGIEPDFAVTGTSQAPFRWVDTFYSPVPSELRTDWTNPRLQTIARIKDCVEKTGNAVTDDPQLAYAQNVLRCAGELNLPSKLARLRGANFGTRLMRWRLNRIYDRMDAKVRNVHAN